MTKEELARKAFEVYRDASDFAPVSADTPKLTWEQLSQDTQIGWIAVVNAVLGVPSLTAVDAPGVITRLVYDPLDDLQEGTIVHFVLPNGDHRPAVIVNVWRDIAKPCPGYVNLQVFTDGANDISAFSSHGMRVLPPDELIADIRRGIVWRTSVCYDQETKAPGTWHFAE